MKVIFEMMGMLFIALIMFIVLIPLVISTSLSVILNNIYNLLQKTFDMIPVSVESTVED